MKRACFLLLGDFVEGRVRVLGVLALLGWEMGC
jgi:hypothetical protein